MVRVVLVLLLGLTWLATGAVARAAEPLTLQIDQLQAPRGTTLTLTGGNAVPGSFVVVIAGFFPDLPGCQTLQGGEGIVAKRVQADADGNFTLRDQPFSGAFAEISSTVVRYSASAPGRADAPGICFVATAATQTFPVTGKQVGDQFLTFWEEHGGLALFGYPISNTISEILDDGELHTVQYFERARFEWHPRNLPPYDLQLGAFGRRIHPPDPAVAPLPGAQYFLETGHNITRPAFAEFWQANGGLPFFGYPISEEFTETLDDGRAYRVQYFERARFEYHPENAPDAQVQLGQFGRTICGDRCR